VSCRQVMGRSSLGEEVRRSGVSCQWWLSGLERQTNRKGGGKQGKEEGNKR